MGRVSIIYCNVSFYKMGLIRCICFGETECKLTISHVGHRKMIESLENFAVPICGG